MNLLTRVKLTFGAIILITLAGFAYGIFDSNPSSPFRSRFSDDGVDLVLHVIYEPQRGTPAIAVQHSFTIPLAYSPVKSPWEMIYRAPPATRVILSVSAVGGTTECTILRDGVIKDHAWADGPGGISCQYLVEPV